MMTKKKTKFQNAITRIERSNKEFKRAGQAKKIMMVAEDVLAMLSLKRLNAVEGFYVELPDAPAEGLKDVSELLKLPRLPACDVCAIGAAMVASTVRLDNVPIERDRMTGGVRTSVGFTPGNLDNLHSDKLSNNMSRQALTVFPEGLLHEMEEAFESYNYGYDMSNSNARLRAIYENLVKNKGKKFTNHETGEVVWRS